MDLFIIICTYDRCVSAQPNSPSSHGRPLTQSCAAVYCFGSDAIVDF